MENIIVIKKITGDYFVGMTKVISIPELQELCRNVTSELKDNGYFNSNVNLVVAEDSIQIVAFIREYNDDLLGTVGFICKQIDEKKDYLELRSFRSNAIIEGWTEEEWCTVYNNVTNCILASVGSY